MPLKLFIKVFFSCESQRKKLTAPRSLCARAPRHCLRLCVCRARAPRPVHWADGVPQPGLCAGRGARGPHASTAPHVRKRCSRLPGHMAQPSGVVAECQGVMVGVGVSWLG